MLLFLLLQFESLYSDLKPKTVGDIVTVIIVEEASGLHETEVSTGKEAKLGFEEEAAGLSYIAKFLSKIPLSASFGFGAHNKHKGKGKIKRKNMLTGIITCRVTDVLENGNLMIYGKKEVVVNRERCAIELSGIIRPEDVEPDNTILSTKIADAKIKYTGKGVVSGGTKKGIFHRLLDWIF